MTFTNLAADADVPAQLLSFSLLNPPSGASVNASNGVFTWRPTIAQSPITHPISVKVADNGSPSLSAIQNFLVTVIKPVKPTMSAPVVSGGRFNFTIAGGIGPDYTILASTNLTTWTSILTSNSPTPPFLFTDPETTNFNQRFYRVLLGP